MKKDIRREILSRRNSLSNVEIMNLSSAIKDKLINMEIFQKAKCIFTYLNFRSEVITDEIIRHAFASGKRVFIPVCVNETNQIVTVEINSLEQLEKSSYGIREAAIDNIRFADRRLIDMAIVPGAAFDKYGNRLGYGAGYYDRFFISADPIYKIALAYSFQILDELVPDAHDIPMDAIVTEKEIIKCTTLK